MSCIIQVSRVSPDLVIMSYLSVSHWKYATINVLPHNFQFIIYSWQTSVRNLRTNLYDVIGIWYFNLLIFILEIFQLQKRIRWHRLSKQAYKSNTHFNLQEDGNHCLSKNNYIEMRKCITCWKCPPRSAM